MSRISRDNCFRVLIYLFPALVDMVMAQFLFISTVRVAMMSASASVSAVITTVWSVFYLIACLTFGRMATPRNSAWLMLGGCVSLAALAGLFTIIPGTAGIYVLMALSGIAAAAFFPPFQTFMKEVDKGGRKSLTYSTGLYTFAWSLGFAVGPFVSGFLMERCADGWRLAYGFAAGAALITAIGIFYLRHLVHPDQATGSESAGGGDSAESDDYSRMPDLAWLAWISTAVGIVALCVIRAVFPSHAVKDLSLGESRLGILFFILSFAQAWTGLILSRSRTWMYRALPVCVAGMFGVAGTACMAFGSSATVLISGAILFGIYSGSFFFYMVFHAIVHPVRSATYVAINEAIVGVSGIIGPLAGGFLSDRFNFAASASASAAAILAVTLFQAAIHRRFK